LRRHAMPWWTPPASALQRPPVTPTGPH